MGFAIDGTPRSPCPPHPGPAHLGADDAIAYTEPQALRMVTRPDARVACAIARGQALAARGDAQAAEETLERVAAGAARTGMILYEVRALHALAAGAAGRGRDGAATTRLAAALRRMVWSAPADLAPLLQDRDGRSDLDVGVLLAGGPALSAWR